MAALNGITIFFTAVFVFLFGALYYWVFFDKWAKLAKISNKDLKKKHWVENGVITFIAKLVTVYALAVFLKFSATKTYSRALAIGFLVWLGFVLTFTIGNMLWEKKNWKLWLFDNVYNLLSIVIMCLILVKWV